MKLAWSDMILVGAGIFGIGFILGMSVMIHINSSVKEQSAHQPFVIRSEYN